MSTPTPPPSERRTATRINSSLSLAYQRISPVEATWDPYDTCFGLPQHFTLATELARIEEAHQVSLLELTGRLPGTEALIAFFNQKLEVMARALEGSLSVVNSPAPQRVSLSESGLSFHAAEPLLPGTHLHLAIGNSVRGYHIAATGRIVFCEEEDLEGYRTGVAFISLRTEDRETLVRDVIRKVRETAVVESWLNPENG